MITKQTFEKMNTEAARLGIIKRKLVTPDAKKGQSIAEYAKMIELQFKVCAKLFRAVLKFGRDHLNDSYQITYVLNMNRLKQAECLMNDLLEESKKLLSEANCLRFQNVGYAVAMYIRWKKKIENIRKMKELAEKLKRDASNERLQKIKEERNNRSRRPPKQKTSNKGLTVDT